MKKMLVKDIIKVTNGKLILGDENEELVDFSKDTRIIKENDTYLAIKGESFDGNEFWREALEKGAKAVIIEAEINQEDLNKFNNKIIIKVEDSLKALYKIAEYKRSLYDIPVIGITGSVGKTSTKDIIASVVSQKYNTLKTEGNNNNNIGLPFTILKLKEHQAAVIEMGMNHLKEISLLSKIAKPTISVITNIGTSHIGNLGSRENILKAKLEILEGMKNPILVLNNDNDLLHKYYEENKDKIQIKTFGINNTSDTQANNIELRDNGSTFKCNVNNKEININVPVGGEHFVLNALCACEIGEMLNISNEKIIKGIEEFKLTNRRMDITVNKDNVTIINDSYNASYESMAASLKYLANIKEGRKVAILGDMFELGEYSEELHQKVGKEVAANKIDILFCTGKNAKQIYEEAIKNNVKEAYYFEEKEEAFKALASKLKNGDIVLVKASNGMRFFDMIGKYL